ncbi:MAG: CAP domain-containing protein, partial [Polyangiaceae bacterium]
MATGPSRLALVFALLVAACAPVQDVPQPATSSQVAQGGAVGALAVEGGATAGATPAARAPATAAVPPSRALLSLDGARRYMVQLINRDRASMGLGPVELDEGPPTRAGQVHAEDMARSGYLGHWGSDGSVPEQRYTEAGGADMVLENASCFTDQRTRTLDPGAQIDPRNVEQAEDMFFHEQPPNDGHRKNILKPWHRRVGIGVAQPVATPTEIPVPCFAQEFVDAFGVYAAVPAQIRVGETLRVSGAVSAPATFAGVGLARVALPAPIPVAELNRRRSYPVPAPYQMYWPPGFQTPIPV